MRWLSLPTQFSALFSYAGGRSGEVYIPRLGVTTPLPVGDADGVFAEGAEEESVHCPGTAPIQMIDHLPGYLAGRTIVATTGEAPRANTG